MKVYDELKARGLIAQTTSEEKVRSILNDGKTHFYIGFDPTADSLHVGHFVQIIVMAHLQRAGHTPIALFGGGTGMVGDPSGKSDMRKMLTKEEVAYNISCFKKQMSSLVDFSEQKALMVNNADWLSGLNYIDFIREIGVHFPVNKMLAAECYKQRLQQGLSFFELNYMIMQSYDFLCLNRKYGCNLQLGGDDQWSNIIGGVELVRRVDSKEAFGMTFSLLTKSDGKKMGKTESGALWLDPQKTSPYDFYQYFRNVDDADVIKCLKILTFVPLEQIQELSKLEGAQINQAKEILAFQVTKLIHGEQLAQEAKERAKNLFSHSQDAANMPTTVLKFADLQPDGISISDLLLKINLVQSKADAKRLIVQGGICLNNEKIQDPFLIVNKESFEDFQLLIKKGKKTFYRVLLQK